MKPPRATTTIVFIAASICSLALGLIVGIKGGDASAEIDFCADSTSGRYIVDEGSRLKSCD